MNNKNKSRLSRIYFVVLVLMLAYFLFSFSRDFVKSDYNYDSFLADLKAGQVKELVINQNKEVPTGKLVISLKNDESKIVYVTDVNKVIDDVEQIKQDNNITVKVRIPDVRRDSIF